ncbi:hypothetical protein [Allobaculum mucilyticum]|uniref:hypothetical protein n=1 Tax=Allobaculum mucilyticum TaxID=2834459 RepID=UPI001E579E1A|nr:hypothetical protein [Allobaculum mucilyticum]UNT96995.1 hypothetical protein KWG62_04395 [Allobaculum mucilyticum]
MSKEIEELQMKELNDVKVLVNEEKAQEPESNSSRRFAQLLEYLWRNDEELNGEAEIADSKTK